MGSALDPEATPAGYLGGDHNGFRSQALDQSLADTLESELAVEEADIGVAGRRQGFPSLPHHVDASLEQVHTVRLADLIGNRNGEVDRCDCLFGAHFPAQSETGSDRRLQLGPELDLDPDYPEQVGHGLPGLR